MADFVAYYRVSPGGRRKDKHSLQADVDAETDKTLGLEAQRRAVVSFLRGQEPVAEFTEIESGKQHSNRPRLAAALDECRRIGATLVIAKLDRLARNVAFIANLMEGKVPFVAADMPDANEMTIHILAAVAQGERKNTSARVKAALSVLKRRGENGEVIGHDKNGNPLTRLGNPRLAEARERARQVPRASHSKVHPSDRMLINELHARGYSLTEIARKLNAGGSRAPKGGLWGISSVRNQIACNTESEARRVLNQKENASV
jgi:DNA invertase Pin-like site-specific DNA recombinase